MNPVSAIAGEFEAHLTVHADDTARLARYAAASGVKFVHIVLARPNSASADAHSARIRSLCGLFESAIDTDWDEFTKDHPDLAGQRGLFAWRLVAALDPMVTSGLDAWRERWIDSIRKSIQRRMFRRSEGTAGDDEYLVNGSGTSTLYQLTVLQVAHDCSPVAAANRLTTVRRRGSPTDGTRVDPHVIAEALQRWGAAAARDD